MISYADLKTQCRSVKKHNEYFVLWQSLSKLNRNDLFESLWKLSLEGSSEPGYVVASYLLVHFEPLAPRSCEELLLEISQSSWYRGDQIIPFYLVVQFGKQNILDSITKILQGDLEEEENINIQNVESFVKLSTISLAEPFHYFEWQEAIEGEG